jgi:hypothetical protein
MKISSEQKADNAISDLDEIVSSWLHRNAGVSVRKRDAH